MSVRVIRSKAARGTVLVSAALALASCQFHLRNQNTLPPVLQQIQVTSKDPYDNFTKQLKAELTLLDYKQHNPKAPQLIIHRHKLSYRIPILGSSQQARIYEYTFNLQYSLKINGNTLIDKKIITINKLLTLNKNALLTTNNQQDLLKTEIQHAAIIQLMNELKSPMTRAQRKQTNSSTQDSTSTENNDFSDYPNQATRPILRPTLAHWQHPLHCVYNCNNFLAT